MHLASDALDCPYFKLTRYPHPWSILLAHRPQFHRRPVLSKFSAVYVPVLSPSRCPRCCS